MLKRRGLGLVPNGTRRSKSVLRIERITAKEEETNLASGAAAVVARVATEEAESEIFS